MLTPERLLHLMIELIFVLLGGLVVWLGLSRRIYVDRHSIAWLIRSAALILWGLRVLYKPGQWWTRWQRIGRAGFRWRCSASTLAISHVPFNWVGPLLAAGGALLTLRGIIGSALIFRPR